MGRKGRKISPLLSTSRTSHDHCDNNYDELAGLSFGGGTFYVNGLSCKICYL